MRFLGGTVSELRAVIVARNENKLKLGTGVVFIKSQLHRLLKKDESWDASFRALPKLISQGAREPR